jgi:hypothetical protein
LRHNILYLLGHLKAGFTHTMPFPCLFHCRVEGYLIHTYNAVPLLRPCHNRAIHRTRAGRPHAVYGRPMLIHTYHAVPMPRCAVALRGCFQNDIFAEWQGNNMACVNQTRPHCVNQRGNTKSKPFAERHGVRELALTPTDHHHHYHHNHRQLSDRADITCKGTLICTGRSLPAR